MRKEVYGILDQLNNYTIIKIIGLINYESLN
jgi:hypothetical protein